jgi:hypothetical protein
MDFINKYGLFSYDWTRSDPSSMIHPDDVEKFKIFSPIQKECFCFDQDEKYIYIKFQDIKYNDETYRVIPELFTEKKEPYFKLKEKVKPKDKSEIYVIRSLEWHFKENEYMYYLLDPNGKPKSRRYKTDELEKI